MWVSFLFIKTWLNLITKSAAPSWISKPSDVEVSEGSSVNIVCEAKGHPKPTVTFKKLTSGEFYSKTITSDHDLQNRIK